MAKEIKELRDSVARLTRKVDELSGLSKQVTKLIEGVGLIREVL